MLMRGFVAAREAGVEAAYLEMGLKGLWEEGLKLDDPEILARRVDSAGLNSASLLAAAQTDRVKLKLADNTAAAVARGVFGVPTFFVGDEMFFGKDRLGQVEEAAQAALQERHNSEHTGAATAPSAASMAVISAFNRH
jgi:2-hydroxychromene-2-carboxylate isomerase